MKTTLFFFISFFILGSLSAQNPNDPNLLRAQKKTTWFTTQLDLSDSQSDNFVIALSKYFTEVGEFSRNGLEMAQNLSTTIIERNNALRDDINAMSPNERSQKKDEINAKRQELRKNNQAERKSALDAFYSEHHSITVQLVNELSGFLSIEQKPKLEKLVMQFYRSEKDYFNNLLTPKN